MSVILLTAALALAGKPERAARPPNLIFILADDLGYGDLGCYGQPRIETPRIDQMAREGMRFTQFYAGSTVCAPSRCVLMTGLNTGHCRIRGNARVNLAPTDRTVAELLRQAGYATGLTGKWGLGQEGSSGVPTRQGFDFFFGYLDQAHAHNYYPTFLLRNEERVRLGNVVPNEGPDGQGVASVKVEYSHDRISDEALRFIEQHKDRPFFLYLALTIPHANNEAGKQGMEVPELGIYAERDWPDPEKGFAAMVTRMDRDVGRLLDRLKQYGIDDQTIVLFTSDNGPHREGGHDPDFFDSNGPLRGIKRDLYEGGVRVPMIVRWPGHVRPGAVSDHVGYFGDFMATAADLTGVRAPGDLDSISFAPSLLGRDAEQRKHDFLYWEFYEGRSAQAVRQGDWKALRSPMLSGRIELYNLARDLGEHADVAGEHAEVVARLGRIMERAHVPSPDWRVPDAARPKRAPANRAAL